MFLSNKKNKGFTVVELLVVILVILVLASISVFALNGQKAKAQDAKRLSDIRQIQTALEFYKSDAGEYPIVSTPIILGSQQYGRLCSKASGGFVSSQTVCSADSNYMSQIPTDPAAGKNYTYTGTASGYDITFTTETTTSLGVAGTYHAHSSLIDSSAGDK
ncbi:MAG: prepilin-type N-terminal cleavage/methylation domain-containing protein [Patescibacteria group bacterium]|nr:prepilin-type N-terminal cleavage/methylation domain-containing protein [Patescibacteria group bacterium]